MAKKLDVDTGLAHQLGAKGYTITMICETLGISRQTAYDNPYILDAIRAGIAEARAKIVDALMARADADASSQAATYLAGKLKVFDDPFTTATPKTVSDAVDRIASIYDAVSAGELNADKGDRLIGYLDKFIRGKEISELELRIENLEKAKDGK